MVDVGIGLPRFILNSSLPASKLNLPQAATLAAVLNSPTYLSSRSGREALLQRYDYVLRGMAKAA